MYETINFRNILIHPKSIKRILCKERKREKEEAKNDKERVGD
jgi:hypothetical protein